MQLRGVSQAEVACNDDRPTARSIEKMAGVRCSLGRSPTTARAVMLSTRMHAVSRTLQDKRGSPCEPQNWGPMELTPLVHTAAGFKVGTSTYLNIKFVFLCT